MIINIKTQQGFFERKFVIYENLLR